MNKLTLTRFIIVSLVFFFLDCACKNEKAVELSILWENGKPMKLVIPKMMAGNADERQLQIFRDSENGMAILGEFSKNDENIVFQPVIPFTRGLTYKVMANGKLAGTIRIPSPSSSDAPKVIAVYPTSDTVPENLLKIYIEFSKPMKEGEALEHLTLIRNGNDTLHDVFLDLQPELWNNDRTVLTVWFDPGRIKRDLQPNLAMGPPLTKGNKYTLLVSQNWQNEDGSELQRTYVKDYVTKGRDSISPDPSTWSIKFPTERGTGNLEIKFFESLDYMLLKNAVHILDKDENEISGKIISYPGENGFSFVPVKPWQSELYTISVESRLEDNAGNNLIRLFDSDLMQQRKMDTSVAHKLQVMLNYN